MPSIGVSWPGRTCESPRPYDEDDDEDADDEDGDGATYGVMTGGGSAGLAAVKRVGGRCTIIDGDDDDKDGGFCGHWGEASAGGDIGAWRCAREKPPRWCESSGSSAPAIGGRTRGTEDTPKRHGGGSAAAAVCRGDGMVAPLLAVGAMCDLAPKGAVAERMAPGGADTPD